MELETNKLFKFKPGIAPLPGYRFDFATFDLTTNIINFMNCIEIDENEAFLFIQDFVFNPTLKDIDHYRYVDEAQFYIVPEFMRKTKNYPDSTLLKMEQHTELFYREYGTMPGRVFMTKSGQFIWMSFMDHSFLEEV